MDKPTALAALSALGHDMRLDVFRLLVKVGDEGLLAGELAQALGLRANTLSAQLSQLSQAGLVHNRREGRGIRYFARMEGMRALLAFLMEDCCGGRPDTCRAVLDEIACG